MTTACESGHCHHHESPAVAGRRHHRCCRCDRSEWVPEVPEGPGGKACADGLAFFKNKRHAAVLDVVRQQQEAFGVVGYSAEEMGAAIAEVEAEGGVGCMRSPIFGGWGPVLYGIIRRNRTITQP